MTRPAPAMQATGSRRLPAYLGRVLDGDCASGTCFQLAPGVIVTAWHVLVALGVQDVGADVMVGPLEPEAGTIFPATVKLFDAAHDLAVLQTIGGLSGSVGKLSPSDTIAWNAKLIVSGVAEIADPGHEYQYAEALGDPGGRLLKDGGVKLARLKSSDVVRGMSGAPVRLSDDETVVVGVVSSRYNSADGWFGDSVWMARTEDLNTLLGGSDNGIARPQLEPGPEVSLSPEEQIALGLILSDPMAANRGTWVYPLHQDLERRGLTTAGATIVLSGLVNLGLVEYVEVPGVDDMTGKPNSAPAYRVTNAGLVVAGAYPGVVNFQDRYSYVLRLSGDEESNVEFLDEVKSLSPVEAQTRFIVPDRDGEARIAVWSHEALDDAFSSIASKTGASILSVKRT